MRVCFANDSFPPQIDGVANAVINYADYMQRHYGSAIVAVPSNPGAEDRYSFEVLRYASLNTTKTVGYRAGFPFSSKAMSRLVAYQPDLLHAHCPIASTFLCRELRELVHKPIVFTYHTKFDIDIRRAIKQKVLQEKAIKEIIYNISCCDDVWVVNEGAGQNLKDLGYRGSYRVMPNGVDINRDAPDGEIVRRLKKTYGLEDQIPLFLFVGRVIWYKGLHIVLDGLRQCRDAGVPFRFAVVGDGADREEVCAEAQKLGIADSCIFTGAEYDRAVLKAWYSMADLFLLPSVFDNNPLVVKEAAACGTASVLVENSSSAEGVVDGENGYLIAESADQMAQRLIFCASHREEVRAAGQRAAQTLYLSWDDSIAKAVQRYEEVLEAFRKGELELIHPARNFTVSAFSRLHRLFHGNK